MSGPGHPGKKPREPKTGPKTQVGFILDEGTIARVRAQIPLISTRFWTPTFSDVLRVLIAIGLDGIEPQKVREDSRR